MILLSIFALLAPARKDLLLTTMVLTGSCLRGSWAPGHPAVLQDVVMALLEALRVPSCARPSCVLCVPCTVYRV